MPIPNHENAFQVELVKQHSENAARVLRVQTPHGVMMTPCFMPVGTHATVSAMTAEELLSADVQMILGRNTYHMICSPGLELLRSLGGMHPFMGWNGPMLTDSGGYQIFSLSRSHRGCAIDNDGAVFRDPITGQSVHPASSIGQVGKNLPHAGRVGPIRRTGPRNGRGRRGHGAVLASPSPRP